MRSHRVQSRWRVFILLMCCEVVLAGATGANAPKHPSPPPSPKAVTPFTSFNFGDVYTGEFISQIFVIRNEGDADLKLLDFKGG